MPAEVYVRVPVTDHRARDYPRGSEGWVGVSGAVRGDYRTTGGRCDRQFCDCPQRTSSTSSGVQ